METSNRSKVRIVVADDNHDAAMMLSRGLDLSGFQVVATVHDGESAVSAIQRERPDVAVLDIGMPLLTGYEVARRIRDNASAPQPKLIAVTGWGNPLDRATAEAAGFDAHLVKPIALDKLEEAVLAFTGPGR
ncbi:MAG TPA: response regulator [Pirellulaceae bacterium]|nr:response regulator [Pirellulaceae bacterium]